MVNLLLLKMLLMLLNRVFAHAGFVYGLLVTSSRLPTDPSTRDTQYQFVALPNQVSPAGTLAAGASKSFYFDLQDNEEPRIALRLEATLPFSRAMGLRKVRSTTVQLPTSTDVLGLGGRQVKPRNDTLLLGEAVDGSVGALSGTAETVTYNVFVRPLDASLGRGRVFSFDAQFMMRNDTDMPLFVRQRGRREYFLLNARSSTPFSWHALGVRQILVRFAEGPWTDPLNVQRPAAYTLRVVLGDVAVMYWRLRSACARHRPLTQGFIRA